MKKIIMIFAAMAAVLSSCSKNEIESGLTTESKDIVLDISVSNPGADDTKALIKEGWVENDEISIWFNTNTGSTPDLVIKYDGSNWAQTGDANNVPTSGSGYVKAVYKNNVIVASKDNYSVSGNTLSFKIENWVFLTEIQVFVKGLWSGNASKYTLSCDKFTPLASSGNGYTVGSDNITVSTGTKSDPTNGIPIPNEDGIAFVFATADYSSSSSDKKDFEFTIKETGGIPQTYKPNVAIVARDGKKSIKALTFANPNYVEIPAMYNGSTTTALKWYRQNLAITGSGDKKWKGGSTSAVKVPGTNVDVIVGDYFQWGAYEGYCGNATSTDKGLLIYNSFTNKYCVGSDSESKFTFKTNDEGKNYQFATSDATESNMVGISPYCGDKSTTPPTYIKYNSLDGATQLEYSDDAARIILGGNWRMPTKDEFDKMIAATYWAWDDTDKGYYVFMPGQGTSGAANGKGTISPSDNKTKALLFFPAAGSGENGELRNVYGTGGIDGNYWTRTKIHSSSANDIITFRLFIVSISRQTTNTQGFRSYGYSIRPVSD